MIEPIMYLAIGFLVSALFGLMIVPLVHNRAVRLTTKRMEAATPLSMAEIQADKDQLRAEFAMSARRLDPWITSTTRPPRSSHAGSIWRRIRQLVVAPAGTGAARLGGSAGRAGGCNGFAEPPHAAISAPSAATKAQRRRSQRTSGARRSGLRRYMARVLYQLRRSRRL